MKIKRILFLLLIFLFGYLTISILINSTNNEINIQQVYERKTKIIIDKKLSHVTITEPIIEKIYEDKKTDLIILYYKDKNLLKEKILKMNTQEIKKEIKLAIKYFSKLHDVDEKIIMAMVKKESQFNPKAVSHKLAGGLMQLMPATSQKMGVSDIFNPFENLEGGIKYFKLMLVRFDGNVKLALAAYNAGPTTVRRYNGIPPYNETKHYIKTVLKYREEYYGSN